MKKLSEWLLGAKKNPLSQQTHKGLALSIFFAWIGLGSDGISSSCYGPEQSFLALNGHHSLSIWLVLLTMMTIFLISYAYNRVINLFPNGGGGYKVATALLGEYAGLITGIALLIDYALTIVISVASGMDALFSLFPSTVPHKVVQLCSALMIMFLTYLNMRGMKESVKTLMPIFLGFIMIHLVLISYGFLTHGNQFLPVAREAIHTTSSLWSEFGSLFMFAVLMHAYAQGGGTYTGLEAVSNNVNALAEPRVRTGQWAMICMAFSLAIMAGGILLLYLFWHVTPVPGKTLNAVLFGQMLGNSTWGHLWLTVTLVLEAGLLFIAANTGFLGGPAVLSNMGVDQWVPKLFVNISSRLVKQNGVLLFGAGALMLLFVTDGRVNILVVIYSISVFLAFTISIFGLLKYFSSQEASFYAKLSKLFLLSLGFIVCAMVLVMIAATSFLNGGWIGFLLIGLLLLFCLAIRKDYRISNAMLNKLTQELIRPLDNSAPIVPIFPDPKNATAIIFVGGSCGAAMHTFLTIKKLFKDHYKNFIFVSIAVIDSRTVVFADRIQELKKKNEDNLNYLVKFCHIHGMPSASILEIAVDPIEELTILAQKLAHKYPDNAFFASQLLFSGNNWIQRINHNKTALAMQRELYILGLNMMILPVKVNIERKGLSDLLVAQDEE